MEPSYSVVFDVAQAGYQAWTFPAFGLIFVAIGLSFFIFRLWRFSSLRKGQSPAAVKWSMVVWTGFAVFWTVTAFSSSYSSYRKLRSAALTGASHMVEGTVTDFVPMPYSGHSEEKFCVNGECFAYSDSVLTGGFNQTSSHGGPIREGLKVRVHHVDGVIVRLEIAR